MKTVLFNNDKVYLSIKKEDVRKVQSILESNEIDFEGFWDNYKEIFYDENSKKLMKDYAIGLDHLEDTNTRLYDLHEYIFKAKLDSFIKEFILKNYKKE